MVVYYWFKGVPYGRIGGPWWAEKSPKPGFLQTLIPHLYAWAVDRESTVVNMENGSFIAPPKGLEIEYSESGHSH
jgi:hypothetical protein